MSYEAHMKDKTQRALQIKGTHKNLAHRFEFAACQAENGLTRMDVVSKPHAAGFLPASGRLHQQVFLEAGCQDFHDSDQKMWTGS